MFKMFKKLPVLILLIVLQSFSLQAFESYNRAPTMKDGAILHAWCWSFNTIKENMAVIADAGYTSVQTSPINKVLVGEGGGMQIFGNGKWYYHYQPISYEIGNYQLGTEAEFIALCEEAEKYGIKIIVDAVINHCTSNYSAISQEIKDIEGGAFHTYGEISSWNDRYQLTQYKLLGLWDWNTQNPNVQQYLLNYLKKCVELGASGFRYDGAKHIELPAGEDNESFASDFWPIIINNGAEFQYLETLQGESSLRMDYYSQYGSVTASFYGGTIRTAIRGKNFSTATISDFRSGGAPTDKLVTWVESHDNYCNDNTYRTITDQQIKWGWAIIGARKDGTPLFFSRPNNGGGIGNQWGDNVIGVIGSSLFKDPEVRAINRFRNVMTGEDERLSNPNENRQILMIERGDKGIVIINSSTSDIELNVPTTMPFGNYSEVVTGNLFQVANNQLTGIVKAGQIAVLTDGYLPVSINTTPAVQTSIQIDPNPAKNYINLRINGNVENLNYQIYDMSGKLLKNSDITNENTIINISRLSSGIYFIKVLKNNQQVEILKFVKE